MLNSISQPRRRNLRSSADDSPPVTRRLPSAAVVKAIAIASKKVVKRPAKPYKTFELYPHPSGKWAKKIRGSICYFGAWAKRVNGKLVRVEGDGWAEALEEYERQARDLHAGRTPRVTNTDGLTVAECCDRFLTSKLRKKQAGEITESTFAEYKQATDRIIAAFGKRRLVEDLAADDFASLREAMAESWGCHRMLKMVTCCKSVFKFAFDNGYIDRPVRYGTEFDKPSKDVMRRHRAKQPKRLFTADEIRQLLDGKRNNEQDHILGASVQLRAMVLLGINCGFGNTDIATLTNSAVDLKGGWIAYARPKNGIPRQAKLWPETLAALRKAVAERPHDGEIVFVTRNTHSPWMHGKTDAIKLEFKKLMHRLGINGRKGLGFYSLRHTFRTVADAARDQPAARMIMGHADSSIDDHYREAIEDERLVAVADHVRAWLFGKNQRRAK
jgi:integrase